MGKRKWWALWKRENYNFLEPTRLAISEFKKLKAFERVAEIAEAAGFAEKAIANYARAGEYDAAISLAKQNNLTKKAEEIRQRVLLRYGEDARRYTFYAHALNPETGLKPSEDYVDVVHKGIGRCTIWTVPIEEYAKRNTIEKEEANKEFYNAIRIAKFKDLNKEMQLLYEKGIKYHIEKRQYFRAAALAKGMGYPKKAREFMRVAVEELKATDPAQALDLAEKEGLTELAVTLCVENEKYAHVVKIAEKAGLMGIAKEYYEKAMREWEEKKFFHLAAVMADKANFPRKATQLYQISIKKYQQELKEGIEFGAMFSSTLSNALKKDDPKDYQDLKANRRIERYHKRLQEERGKR